jgi:outer membrane protein assembly factor BamA
LSGKLRVFFSLLGFFLLFASKAQLVESIRLDTTGQKVITDFIFEGNKLTKERIIMREVTLNVGDTLYWSNLQAGIEQSQNNVMNLRLFNFVEMEPIQVDNEHIIILISVQERWYIYPVPIFEIAQTNFNTWWETKELRWLNYGLSVSHSNFRGLNQDLSLTLRFGYTKKYSASWSIPNLNKKQTLGLYLSAGYFENNEIVYNTENNERLFYNNSEDKARQYFQYKAGLSYREDIYLRHYFEVSYFDARVNDTIPIVQPDYFTGGGNTSQFLRASYSIQYDTRDYRRYPLKGMMLFGTVSQDGLGLVNKEGLGLFTTFGGYRQHYKMANRWYLAHNLEGKVNWDEPPYYLLRGLGYGNFVRGYEFYVVDGTAYGLFQSNVKFEILKPKSITIPFVPSEKFSKTFVALYANLFFDAGYVEGDRFSATNSLVNEYLYSVGAGLDLVTYYDKVVRVEGSINALGEAAVYVHFKQVF